MNKRLATIGLTLSIAGGGLIGAIAGQPQISGATAATTTTSSATATATPTKSDHANQIADVLKPLVDDGTLTQAQLDKVISTLDAARPANDGQGRHGGQPQGPKLDSVASKLGLPIDALRTELQSGKTLADVAAAKGIDKAVIVDVLVSDISARITSQVADGSITQTEADTRLADVEARATDLVDNTAPAHRHGGHDAPPADAPTAPAPTAG